VPETEVKTNLFNTCDRARSQKLVTTIDQLNRQFSSGTVRFASMGLEQPWALKATHCSPRDTTCWQYLLVVRWVSIRAIALLVFCFTV